MSFSSDLPLQSNQLEISIDFPKTDTEDFNNLLSLSYKRIVDSVNFKEGSLYTLKEIANFQRFFPNQSGFTDNTFNLRNGYRTTFDMVKLNGANISVGVTNLVLTSSTEPPAINGALYPTRGVGGAVANSVFYFVNDPLIYVRFTPATQTITITNNSGFVITSFIWTMEYLKV